jgi:tRNA(adenine34) deaminase
LPASLRTFTLRGDGDAQTALGLTCFETRVAIKYRTCLATEDHQRPVTRNQNPSQSGIPYNSFELVSNPQPSLYLSRMDLYTDEYFMREALKEANKAFEDGEIPVGAVVRCQNKIIARTHNQTERLTDSTAHAEMLAVTSATNYLGSKYLDECTLYVTLEPCVMCAGALHWAQLQKLVYGASDVQRGYSLVSSPLLHPRTEVVKGVSGAESKELIDRFFKRLREK